MAVTRRGLCAGAVARRQVEPPPRRCSSWVRRTPTRASSRCCCWSSRPKPAFYAAALDAGILEGELLDFAETVAAHEREHLAVVQGATGDPSVAPDFDFGAHVTDPATFARAAARLEDAAVGAYNGQAGNVSTKVFAVAARIVSVEARHAAWVRSIEDRDPAPDATDRAWTEAQVRRTLEEIGGTA